jgi:hypothetical protein
MKTGARLGACMVKPTVFSTGVIFGVLDLQLTNVVYVVLGGVGGHVFDR